MTKRKPTSKMETQGSDHQDDEGQNVAVPEPATPALATANQLTRGESEASPPKKRRHSFLRFLGSSPKPEETTQETQKELDYKKHVLDAMNAVFDQPVPDPRAKPTKEPPRDHYYNGRKWSGIGPNKNGRDVASMDYWLWNWAYNYANDKPEDIEARMTAKDKQAIIDHLGDWCLYDDWDSLVATFAPIPYRNRFQLLLAATILKDIFESVFRNPFFYIDLGEEWDGSGSDIPTPYGEELNQFFKKSLEVSPIAAHNWRASTVRLFNLHWPWDDKEPIIKMVSLAEYTRLMAKDLTRGVRAHNIRERYIDQLTTNMLDDSSLISPIVSTKELSQDEARSRYADIRDLYTTASKMAVRFSLQKSGFEFEERVKGVAPYKVPSKEFNLAYVLVPGTKPLERWLASKYCAEHVYDQLLNDKRPVLVMWPAIWQIRWKVPHGERKEIEECEAKEPIDYDRFYRDEQGSIHRLVASGVVMVEKDGREPPLPSSDEEEEEDDDDDDEDEE